MASNGKNRNGNNYALHRRTRRNLRRSNVAGNPRISRLVAALIVLAAIGFIGLLIVGVAGIIAYRSYADGLVAPDELAINQPSYGAKIYDRNGKLLYEYVDDRSGLRRPIKLEEISPAFLAATIATEDDSFFTNPGVNWRGLARAAWENSPFGGSGDLFEGSGGSSITQQLVKNVYIGQEVAAGSAQVEAAIRLLKDELRAIPSSLPAFDPERETAELRAELEKREPTPLVIAQLEVLGRLETKLHERELLDDQVQGERQERSVERKVKEIIYAIELTNRYSKEQILEWYVNQISYGGVYNGVEAASQGYFGKSARDLTLAESALLAGIPQSPSAYDPVNNPDQAIGRRNLILDIMQRQHTIQIGDETFYEAPPEEYAAARETSVQIATKRFPIEAPHFVLQYIEPQLASMFGRDAIFRDGLVVTTSLDLDLYNESTTILERWIREFEGVSNSKNGAVTVIDPRTGEILVMVGSRDYFREDIEGKNNNATALNSPGSAFKPFVYLTSFLRLGWGPGTTILDTPISIPQSDGTVFTPTNPGRNFQGSITIRNALGNSLNIPPIKTAIEVGVSNVVAQAKKMGFTSLTGFYGPAIATGGVDITALDLSYGYSVLAAGGVMNGQEPLVRHRAGERTVDPISILKVTDAENRVRFDVEPRRKSERIVGADYAYLISTILSDGSAQCITFGCGGITIPGRQAATKTGTSEPFDPKGPNAGKIGDTWAFGYTPELVVGIWAGNSNNAPVDHIYSTSISFRAMRDVMQMVFAGRPSTPFVRPADVVEASVCMPSGLKPTDLCGRKVTDIFAKASVPTKDDDWWKRVRIDTRNNLLAAPDTPPQFVEEKVMLVPPGATPEGLKAFADQGYPVAPTETSTAGNVGSDLSALITSPAPGFNASGFVQVTGRATSDRFQEYRLEYGVGAAPRSWARIAQSSSPVANGTLGIWDTARLEPGIYTIRLVVEDSRRGEITSTVSVFVGEPGAAPGATPRVTPTPRRN